MPLAPSPRLAITLVLYSGPSERPRGTFREAFARYGEHWKKVNFKFELSRVRCRQPASLFASRSENRTRLSRWMLKSREAARPADFAIVPAATVSRSVS